MNVLFIQRQQATEIQQSRRGYPTLKVLRDLRGEK